MLLTVLKLKVCTKNHIKENQRSPTGMVYLFVYQRKGKLHFSFVIDFVVSQFVSN